METQQRFKSERCNIFTKEINKITLNSTDDKRMQSIDSMETYAYKTRKYLMCKKENINCNNKVKKCKKT